MLGQRTTRRLQASWIVRLFVVLALLEAGSSNLYAAITDNGNHPPPTTGPYGYGSFIPGSPGFPAMAGTYVDPVFGETVRRITDIGAKQNNEDIYGHHWANANGSYLFSRTVNDTRILNPTTGAVVRTGVPCGSPCFEMNWHPTNPDRYYYLNGSALVEYSVSAGTSTTIHTFAGTLQSMGGSLNWIDGTGDLFVVMIGGRANLWKRSINLIYTNTVAPLGGGGGWVSISPDGNYLITAAGPKSEPHIEHYSYAINHSTHTVNPTPVNFWGLCGDHGAISSASNGKTYFITYDCNYSGNIWRADVSIDTSNMTAAQQQAANLQLVPIGFTNGPDGHMSGGVIGAMKDWVFIDHEKIPDSFGNSVTGWLPYRSEIIAVNILTGEVRRLAHHRSRVPGSSGAQYYDQPRISCSWDGSLIIWTSNYNSAPVTGYSDMYGMGFHPGGGGGDTTPPAAPVNLQIE